MARRGPGSRGSPRRTPVFTPFPRGVRHCAGIATVEFLPVYKGVFEFSPQVLPTGWDLIADYSQPVPSFANASSAVSGHSGKLVFAVACPRQRVAPTPALNQFRTASTAKSGSRFFGPAWSPRRSTIAMTADRTLACRLHAPCSEGPRSPPPPCQRA